VTKPDAAVLRHLLGGGDPGDPRTGHEDVDSPELLLRLADDSLDARLGAHVALEPLRPHAEPFDLLCDGLAAIDPARADDDIGSGFCQAESKLAADPAPAARDDRRAAAQVEQLTDVHSNDLHCV
jgi:hypothetical protein